MGSAMHPLICTRSADVHDVCPQVQRRLRICSETVAVFGSRSRVVGARDSRCVRDDWRAVLARPRSQVSSHCPKADGVWLHHLTCRPADIVWEKSPDGGGVPEHGLAVRMDKWMTDHQPALKAGCVPAHTQRFQVFCRCAWRGASLVLRSASMAFRNSTV